MRWWSWSPHSGISDFYQRVHDFRPQRVHDFSPTCAQRIGHVNTQCDGTYPQDKRRMIQNETYRARTFILEFPDFRTVRLWEINFCCLGHLAYGVLLWWWAGQYTVLFLCILFGCIHWALLHVKCDFCNTLP